MKKTERLENRIMGRTPKGFLRIVVSVVLGVGGAMIQEAAAQAERDHCVDVLRASRQTMSVIANSERIAHHAKSFCDQHYSKESRSSTRSYKASYKVLSGSMSGGSASYGEVAEQYCSSDKSGSERSDAYQQYLTTLPVEAYQAYNACKTLSKKQIRIRLEDFLEKEMAIAVDHMVEGQGNDVRMVLEPSAGITCHRRGGEGNEQLEWKQPRGTSVVECAREDSARKGRVTVYSPDIPSSSLTLSWDKYEKGHPVDRLRDLQQRLTTLERNFRSTNAELESVRTELRSRAVHFGEVQEKEFDQVYQAPSAGLVTARVEATGIARSDICGWVMESAESRQDLKRNGRMLAQDTMHYSGGGTNVSGAGISMPVRKGEFWVVTRCAGSPQNTRITTYFHPLREG